MKAPADRVMDAYQSLLRLYPHRFQQEYGDEMATVFAKACRDSVQISEWALWRLGLREVWDLPGNLIREYSSDMGRQGMYVQTVPEESPARSIFRGMVSFAVGFTLVYLVYCLVDTFLNFGKTLYQGRSVWNLLYLHPTALAYSVGAAILAAKYGKRKVWLSALATFIIFTLFYRIWAATYLAQRTSATQNFNFDLFIVPVNFFNDHRNPRRRSDWTCPTWMEKSRLVCPGGGLGLLFGLVGRNCGYYFRDATMSLYR